MRIRSIKPDYWKDAKLHNTPGVSADVREFYIGLWGLADDAGWLRFNVPEVSAELYRYRPQRRRERDVSEWTARLEAIGRVKRSPNASCPHLFLPNLSKHQRVGGSKTEAVWREHTQTCVSAGDPPPVHTNMDESISFPTGREGKGSIGKGREVDLTNISDPALRARLLAKAVGE